MFFVNSGVTQNLRFFAILVHFVMQNGSSLTKQKEFGERDRAGVARMDYGKTVVITVDIERSGRKSYTGQIIGMAWCAVNEKLEVLDSGFYGAYFPGETLFGDSCKVEFWDEHPKKLAALKYDGELNQAQRLNEIVTAFQAFRAKWEKLAKEAGFALELVSDNNVYDGGFVNELIMTRTTDMPIPYRASDGEYSTFWETHSMQRGLLMAAAPEFDGVWGLSEKVQEVYGLPPSPWKHDHNPLNDALSIAYDAHVLLRIRNEKLQPKARAE